MREPGSRALGLVFLSFLLLVGSACDAPRQVQIPLNGTLQEGLYWEPAKRLSPAVLLLAPPGQEKESWVSLGTRLRQQGYGVLALELSGGQSANDELRAAFEWMRLQKKVDAARIGLVAADQAANPALAFAAREPLVRLVVLLSPGLKSSDKDTLAPPHAYGFRPILLAATDEAGRAPTAQAAHDELVAFLDRHL